MVYAVRKGRSTGIFETWKECEPLVKGYRGAEFKKFKSIEDAEKYLHNIDIDVGLKDVSELQEHELVAYVDGSYSELHGDYGYGVVVINNKGEEFIYRGRGNHPELVEMRNVAGELMGAVTAVKVAIQMGKKDIYLHYDYQGIESWATGEWKAKNEVTKDYRDYLESIKFVVNIHFIKVAAHTGVKYNEMVDKLAKMRDEDDEMYNM